VLISNVGMIEEYVTCAHNLVVLSGSNIRRKGCVDLQCGCALPVLWFWGPRAI
jgi:hypothetical protein